jgi:endonuclease YncB( thermonuclease family)
LKTYTLLFLFIGFWSPINAEAQIIAGRAQVIDGDTIEIQRKKIRLYAIDAFESKQICKISEKSYLCGNKSAWHLDTLINSRTVICKGKDKDRYGRIIADCAVGNLNLNEAMVRAGWALAYRKYSGKYISSEVSAINARAGAWQGQFVAPWDYRQNKTNLYPRNQPVVPSTILATSPNQAFKSCKEARNHGMSRIPKNDPRYNPKLDGDKDGIACE